jgi:membrane-bound lytic murein transglycosylase MltF
VLPFVALSLTVPATADPQPTSRPTGLTVHRTKWTGDLDGMVGRRVIRALVVHSRTTYFVDKGQPYGTSYELLSAFEDALNAKPIAGSRHLKLHVVFIPTTRDDLIPALLEGRGDIATGALTITPERGKQVDFGAPLLRDVKEVVVTGPESPALATLDALSGQEVVTRRSSSYWEHLEQLNRRFEKEGKPPVRLRAVPENLEDEDLLEMLSAGLVKIVVADEYKAALWAKILPRLTVHADVAVHEGGDLTWMVRKGSPLLKAEIDAFAKTHGHGTLFGNTVLKKYAGSTRFVRNATAPAEVKKYERLVGLFRTYGSKYAMDYLLMMAQGYQESRLDQNAKSRVGAVGVMQIMPATARDLKVGDIRQVEPNIHGGIKYVRTIVDRYFADEPIDDFNKALFAFAAYNCGPRRLAELRRETAKNGLNPNVWFQNVEVTAARRIGSETVTYVANIFKYYVAYTLLAEDEEERQKSREQVRKG